ncbi:MAG: AMP-binding protein, partial [Deltaproteobacteria bacterium]|nr:AMP-binding protein [Deltaproteobacteria bacterium]
LCGAAVELVSRETAADGELLCRRLAPATMMQATPATWHLLLAAGWNGDAHLTTLCGGEALSPRLAAQLVPRAAAAWNMYGPTETTIWSSVHAVAAADGGEGAAVTIGRPIANTTFRIVDQELRPQPLGVPGELLIGGAGLARGYHRRPRLTAARFVPDALSRNPGERLYRTGDLARWGEGGRVDFLGRIDTQVKLRGFRIELGEIESLLAAHPLVEVAVVVLGDFSADSRSAENERSPSWGGAEDVRLIAYLVPAGAAQPEALPLRRHLR